MSDAPLSFHWWATSAPAVASARWAPRTIGTVQATERDSGPYVVPKACLAVALRFNNSFTSLATDTMQVTLVRAPNGSITFADTTLTFQIPAVTAAGTSVGVTGSVALAAGDLLALKLLQSGATGQTNWFAAFSLICV